MEPAPLWASCQNPFSACRQSKCQRILFYFEMTFAAGPVLTSQIKKPRKRFCWVEPAPLWASSYTHLLYKVQVPFSACRQSKFKNEKHFYFEISFDAGPVFATQMKNLRKRFCWVEPAPLQASSCTHLLYTCKIHSVHAVSQNSKKRRHFYFEISFDAGPESLLHRSRIQEENNDTRILLSHDTLLHRSKL